jgi:hypothetical protein
MRRRLRTWGACALGVTVGFVWTGTALGQEAKPKLGGGGVQFIFGADRLWGFNWYQHTTTTDYPGATGTITTESKETNASYGFFWDGSGGISSVPRLSFDTAVFLGLTVGGSVGLMGYSSKTSSKTSGATSTTPDPITDENWSSTNFVLSPRVGWVMMFTDVVGLWPRVGLTYANSSAKDEYTTTSDNVTHSHTTSEWTMGASVDVPFILAPTPHFALTAAPVIDWFPLGKVTYKDKPASPTPTPNVDTKTSLVNVGLVFGVMGWF